MSTLGNRLRACRKGSGYTQTDVCARIGIKQGTLSELENDKYPTSSYVPHFAKLYGVEAMWLATGRGPKDIQEARTYKLSDTALRIAIAISDMPQETQVLVEAVVTAMQSKQLDTVVSEIKQIQSQSKS